MIDVAGLEPNTACITSIAAAAQALTRSRASVGVRHG